MRVHNLEYYYIGRIEAVEHGGAGSSGTVETKTLKQSCSVFIHAHDNRFQEERIEAFNQRLS